MLLDAPLNENTEVKIWEAGAPKPDDFSLQRGPPHSAFGLYHLLRFPITKGEEPWVALSSHHLSVGPTLPGEPVKHVPATLGFGSVSLDSDPGIHSTT